MKIRYIVKRRDIVYANIKALLSNRVLVGAWILVSIWISNAWASEEAVMANSLGFKIALFSILFLLYLGILSGVTIMVTAVLALLRKSKGIIGEHQLTLSDEGITETTEFNKSLNKWIGYHKTISTKRYLMLFVCEGQYHIISKSRPLLEGNLSEFEIDLNQRTAKT